MAYQHFAYWYDDLNQNADYDTLMEWIQDKLAAEGITSGIVADLGCGTGEATLRLASADYDMIAVDASEDMLAVLRNKAGENKQHSILLLNQDLAELDLYGTICGAISTFDTLNHLAPSRLRKALARVGLFMEEGGLLIFDANTPYKHTDILANREFQLELDENAVFRWNNRYDPDNEYTEIMLCGTRDGQTVFEESFAEYIYDMEFWHEALRSAGFAVLNVLDGETFGPLMPESQRYLIAAKKQPGS